MNSDRQFAFLLFCENDDFPTCYPRVVYQYYISSWEHKLFPWMEGAAGCGTECLFVKEMGCSYLPKQTMRTCPDGHKVHFGPGQGLSVTALSFQNLGKILYIWSSSTHCYVLSLYCLIFFLLSNGSFALHKNKRGRAVVRTQVYSDLILISHLLLTYVFVKITILIVLWYLQ